jgi:hypothetical protein
MLLPPILKLLMTYEFMYSGAATTKPSVHRDQVGRVRLVHTGWRATTQSASRSLRGSAARRWLAANGARDYHRGHPALLLLRTRMYEIASGSKKSVGVE